MRLAIIVVVAVCVAAALVAGLQTQRKPHPVVSAGFREPLSQGYPACDPGVQQYSGTFDIQRSTNMHYFFWMFESRSNPKNDPVILWMTGGPGCSSSLALLVENGACHLKPDGTLYSNQYSWNEKATVIYIDQPAGVGFSYADMSGYAHDEKQVGDDMYMFMQAFYKRFPQFLSNKFFVAGESYGGHYAPATAHRLLVGNQRNEGVKIPLAGLGVGNGWIVPEVQFQHYGDLAYTWCEKVLGKPCVSREQYDKMQAAIPSCVSGIQQCNNTDTGCKEAYDSCSNTQNGPFQLSGLNVYDIRKPCVGELCYNFTVDSSFMNRESVQKALGVHNAPLKWQPCSMTVDQMFKAADKLEGLEQAVADLLEAGVRVLIYAGDMDFICNWIGNKAWATKFEFSGHEAFANAADKKWVVDGKEAGVYRHIASQSKNLNTWMAFMQVHDAGHMVPMDQPKHAQMMINSFLNDEPVV